MYLKSVDIVGYKSFANKTHLDLEPGITGVIGPNGCGKSNIMESVRWCLGEMSWKSLRADSMTDVIFAGTAKKAPLGMTEVTLVFDNASSRLPVQFSEVTVSRRIFRSGESEYYLNKTQCRLRDIRELFLDTGVGGDGYAIIDQGGVDFVLSSKPEDRRSLFEEAAGVAKYKAKREEALRKLERVEADVMRLQDSVSLIEEQVKKLDSDARKARLFTKYKEELAALEAAHVVQEAERIGAELDALAAASRPVEEKLGDGRARLSAEGANLAATDLERTAQRNTVIAANQKVAEAAAEMARLEERLSQARQASEENDQRRKACEEERAVALARREAMVSEIDLSQKSVAEARERLAAAEKEAAGWQERLDALSAQRQEKERNFEALRQETLNYSGKGLESRRQISSTEALWTQKESAVRSGLRQLERESVQSEVLLKELAALEASLQEQAARTAGTRAERDAALSRCGGLRERLEKAASDIFQLQDDISTVRVATETVKARGAQDPYWSGAHAVLNASIPGVLGTVRQMIKISEAHKAALEDVLGERLYALVCEDSSAARAAVEYLESSGKGRARFLVLSSLPPRGQDRTYPAESRPLLGQIEFSPAHENAVRFLLEESYAMGRVLFGDHWVYGGAASSSQAPVSLADLGELTAKMEALSARRESARTEKAGLENETREAERGLAERESALIQEQAREHALSAEQGQREQSLQLKLAEVSMSTSDAAGTLAEMSLLKERLLELRQAARVIETQEEELRAQEQLGAAALALVKEEHGRLQSSREYLEAGVAAIVKEVALLTKEFDRLVIEDEQLAVLTEQRRSELSSLERRRQETTERADAARQQLAVLSEERAALESQAGVVHARLTELDKAYLDKEEELRGLKVQTDLFQQELHGLEVQSSSLRSRRDMLAGKLFEEYHLSLEEAKLKSSEPVDPQRIESLRKRLANMGNINLAAPEEYEALAKRRDFLSEQIADLGKARDDLKSAIAKINASTRENFRQTFVEVREHFRRLYGVLFEGGEADLVLTDPDNILETGVDIVAQPPGKRLQHLSLLSGGEKALTAIALLFAFFMVKPSPFCMLDEADSALDDANIERFTAILREFQSRTQFLIVSHNKRTMEAADVIYGVTMEEMGVSQIVSVDFRKKNAEAKPASAPETSVSSA